MSKDIRAIEKSEVVGWEELALRLPEVVPTECWKNAARVGRAELLEKAHREMRPAFGLDEPTRVVFAKEVEEGDESPEGMAFDDEKGEYIIVTFASLEDHADPCLPLAGLAHELRHAFQMQSIWGGSTDPRVEEWRSCHRSVWRGSESGALETDARRPQDILKAALGGKPA